jgi:protein ImuA
MTHSNAPLARLKRRLERLERPRSAGAGAFTLGLDTVDARLGGGLARGALHELCAGAEGDHSAVSGFALMLAARASREDGAGREKPILWVREDKGEQMNGGLYGPGMIELGIDPDQIILVSAPDTLSALRVAADILGVMALGAVVIEPWGAAKALDLTASRKLVLAAEKSGVAAFILRAPGVTMASAAATRWLVSAAPSTPLLGNAPGLTTLSITLVRHRGGVAPFEMMMEWNRDEQIFCDYARGQALLRAVLPDTERRQMAA